MCGHHRSVRPYDSGPPMTADARIATGLPAHPKTRKLLRRLGPAGGWSLVCLFLWTASNRPSGDLSGLSAEDLELAADWAGDSGAFVSVLCEVRFLDGDDGSYTVHDWAIHNPWAAAYDKRRESAMHAARMRWACESHAAPTKPQCPIPIDTLPVPKQKLDAPPSAPPDRGKRLPADWQPTPEQIAWAKAKRPDLDPAVQAEMFRDHWHAKPGKDGRKVDWAGTWRNWIRNGRAITRPPPSAPRVGGSPEKPPEDPKVAAAKHAAYMRELTSSGERV